MDTERKSKYGTISVSPEFLSKFRDFCEKCHITQTEMMSAIFEPLFGFTEKSQHVSFGVLPKEHLSAIFVLAFPLEFGVAKDEVELKEKLSEKHE